MLEIQQYLDLHPLKKMSLKLKSKYMVLLAYFISRTGSEDMWSKQMLKLYDSKLETLKKYHEVKDLGFLEGFKFFNYIYSLLTDGLFISCFDDRKKGERMLESIVEFYGERYRKKMKSVLEAFYSYGEVSAFPIPKFKPIYEVIWKNREFLNRKEKRIMITANMSAGKSTLLNALLGKKVNKMQNETCTAKIHYLHNKAGEDGLICEWDYDLELDATNEILMNDNTDNDNTEIYVGARFRSLAEIDSKVCFIDTPGVNSSMEKTHRKMSNEAIRSMDCELLIYLFNAENIGSDDDIKHLKFVKQNYQGNIIFLVNRMDRFRKNIDSVDETMSSMEKDLKKFGFKEPKVYPISAYAAYLAKMSLYGEELNEDEKDELEFLKRKLGRDEFSYERYYPEKVEISEENRNELTDLLVHSGILSLEKILFN